LKEKEFEKTRLLLPFTTPNVKRERVFIEEKLGLILTLVK